MIKSTSLFATFLSALVITFAMAAISAQPAAAQTAKKLKCKGCVKSKQIKNAGIKSKDIRDGQVQNSDLGNNAVTGGKIADGSVGNADLADSAVTLDKLGDDVTALGLAGVAVIGPGDFHGVRGNTSDDWSISPSGYVSGGGDPAEGCVGAPVHLPDGVTITEVELVFVDNSTLDFDIVLHRTSLLDASSLELAVVFTGGINDPALMHLSDTAIDQPIVDAVDFTYLITVPDCLQNSGHRIYAVRIYYE